MEIKMSERIVKLETQMTNIDKKIENHCTDNKEGFKAVLKKLDEMENRFAGKWVEKVAIGVSIVLLGAILVAVIGLA